MTKVKEMKEVVEEAVIEQETVEIPEAVVEALTMQRNLSVQAQQQMYSILTIFLQSTNRIPEEYQFDPNTMALTKV